MKLTRKIDRIFIFVMIFSLAAVFGAVFARNAFVKTFADSEDTEVYSKADDFYVTFYDEGGKLIVKSKKTTIKDALAKAGISIGVGDVVEPGLDTVIDSDFFINIYRARPAVVKDGVFNKFIMTASHDAVQIAKEAGLIIYDGDKVEQVLNNNFLETGGAETYEVTRNGGRQVTIDDEIAFSEEEVKDYNMQPGTREIIQLGETGLIRRVYQVFYVNNEEISRELLSEAVVREPVARIVAVGANEIEKTPLTARMGRNVYTIRVADRIVERQETYYDLGMQGVMNIAANECGVEARYEVREDGVKVDADGYVLVAANLDVYPRCSIVETSLGLGRVYDTGTFAADNPEQFDIATDWTNRNGR